MTMNEQGVVLAKTVINEYYQLINLQIAAEAMLENSDRPAGMQTNTPDWRTSEGLTQLLYDNDDNEAGSQGGNFHSTAFANKDATTAFTDEYTVVAHQANTSTGFSGTLFKDKAGNFYLSFRSTEFDDDHIRDSAGTNQLMRYCG